MRRITVSPGKNLAVPHNPGFLKNKAGRFGYSDTRGPSARAEAYNPTFLSSRGVIRNNNEPKMTLLGSKYGKGAEMYRGMYAANSKKADFKPPVEATGQFSRAGLGSHPAAAAAQATDEIADITGGIISSGTSNAGRLASHRAGEEMANWEREAQRSLQSYENVSRNNERYAFDRTNTDRAVSAQRNMFEQGRQQNTAEYHKMSAAWSQHSYEQSRNTGIGSFFGPVGKLVASAVNGSMKRPDDYKLTNLNPLHAEWSGVQTQGKFIGRDNGGTRGSVDNNTKFLATGDMKYLNDGSDKIHNLDKPDKKPVSVQNKVTTQAEIHAPPTSKDFGPALTQVKVEQPPPELGAAILGQNLPRRDSGELTSVKSIDSGPAIIGQTNRIRDISVPKSEETIEVTQPKVREADEAGPAVNWDTKPKPYSSEKKMLQQP